jgi:PAS domain S-box-containing protein/diguanylate cyclase (GGDEF)-like protein
MHVLILEDRESDAALLAHALRSAFPGARVRVARDRAELVAALAEAPDVILADFTVPGTGALDCLDLVAARGLDAPVIVVTGTQGDEVAAECLRRGAADYLLKDRLSRLGAAVAGAIERKRIERALAEREAALRRAQELARLAHVITGPGGAIESWSETLPRLLGLRAEQIGASVRELLPLVHPQDRERVRAAMIEAGRRGVRMEQEYRARHGDGGWIHLRHVMEPLEPEARPRKGTRWFNTVQDVTAQKLLAEELRASEERYRATFEQAAAGVIHTSPEGEIVLANPAACAMLGYARAELLLMNVRQLTHPQDLAAASEARSRLLAGSQNPDEREMRLLRKDGAPVWVSATTSVLRAAAGEPRQLVCVLQDITARKRAQQELEQFRRAMDLSLDSIYLTDPERLRFVYANESACRRLGYSREELFRAGPVGVLGVAEEELRRIYAQVIAAGEAGLRTEQRYVRSDGTEGWSELHRHALAVEDGHLIVAIGRDITERRLHERRIERLSRTRLLTSRINAAIVRIRERGELMEEVCRIAVEAGGFGIAQVLWVNEAQQEIRPGPRAGEHALPFRTSRFSPGAETVPVRGIAYQSIVQRSPVFNNDLAAEPAVSAERAEAVRLGFRSAVALPFIAEERVVALLLLYARESGYFDEEEVRLLTELAGDVSFALDYIAKSERAYYLAYYDPLTGLANRALFLEWLRQILHGAGQEGQKAALVLADIERLASVNESLGRQAGDALIRELAARLGHAKNASAVARVSGDQFAAVLPAVKGRSEAGRRLDALLHECFDRPFRLDGTELRIAARTGVALYPADGGDAEALLANAEAALRKARELGEARYFYHRALTERVAERLTLENRLRRALERSEFVLHYQPKVDSVTKRIVGVEALIRWQDPQSGLVPPGQFIPLMEETGLILEAGAWALAQAVSDHIRWLGMGLPTPRVAVNVSAIQLRRREFVATVEQALVRGASPPGLDLEITESLVMEDIEANIAKLGELRRLGVGIAIDDFGTGYSSLGYLAKLPAQALKIDRSFIVAMLEDPDTMLLVQTMISLAHSLRLRVIAEGVDSEEQARFLRLLRCDEMQGYLVGRPVPFDEMTRLLANEPRA